MKLFAKFIVFCGASMLLSNMAGAYSFTYYNATKHTVCVNPAGIAVAGKFLMQGLIKNIFVPGIKRHNTVDSAGVIHVNNAGFHGKVGAECIPPGRTATLHFKDIDIGICYDIANSQIGLPYDEMTAKGLDGFGYGMRVRPIMKVDDNWLGQVVGAVQTLGDSASGALAEASLGKIGAAASVVASVIGPIAQLFAASTCKNISFTIMDVVTPKDSASRSKCQKCIAGKKKLHSDLAAKGFNNGLSVMSTAFGR